MGPAWCRGQVEDVSMTLPSPFFPFLGRGRGCDERVHSSLVQLCLLLTLIRTASVSGPYSLLVGGFRRPLSSTAPTNCRQHLKSALGLADN